MILPGDYILLDPIFQDLWTLAKREGRTFAGSTSSLSGMLSQIYFLISADKDVDTSVLSHKFRKEVGDTYRRGFRSMLIYCVAVN